MVDFKKLAKAAALVAGITAAPAAAQACGAPTTGPDASFEITQAPVDQVIKEGYKGKVDPKYQVRCYMPPLRGLDLKIADLETAVEKGDQYLHIRLKPDFNSAATTQACVKLDTANFTFDKLQDGVLSGTFSTLKKSGEEVQLGKLFAERNKMPDQADQIWCYSVKVDAIADGFEKAKQNRWLKTDYTVPRK